MSAVAAGHRAAASAPVLGLSVRSSLDRVLLRTPHVLSPRHRAGWCSVLAGSQCICSFRQSHETGAVTAPLPRFLKDSRRSSFGSGSGLGYPEKIASDKDCESAALGKYSTTALLTGLLCRPSETVGSRGSGYGLRQGQVGSQSPQFPLPVSRVTLGIGDRSLELSEGTGFPWPTAEFL